MAIDYKSPGIEIKEYTDASISALIATPDSICIVGPTPGPIKGSATVQLTDATSASYGTTAGGVKVITGVTQTTGTFTIGQTISGTGIASNTYITDVSGITPNITLTLSNATTATVSNTLTARGALLLDPTKGAVQALTKVVAADPNQVNTGTPTYDSTTGYTVNSYDFASLGTNTTNTALGTNSIARKATPTGTFPSIDNNDTVIVEFTYYPTNYWSAQRFDNMSDIETRYGRAYTDDQKYIYSQVTLAASIAFENGASNVIIQPVFYQDPSTQVQSQPTPAQLVAVTNTWAKTLEALRAVDNVGIIVPISGQKLNYSVDGTTTSSTELDDSTQISILKTVQAHIAYQYTENDEIIIGIFGEDGTDGTSYATQADLQGHTSQLRAAYNGIYAQQSVLVSPSKFDKYTPNGTLLNLGGQYAAAAVAGMLSSRSVSSSLTRKNIIGFNNINDSRTKTQKIDDSKNGLFVIEQKGTLIQVRHALTTDVTSVAKSELSVVRAKQKMVNSLRKTVDEQIIGTIVADNNAPLVIGSAITGVLNRMVDDKEIVGFSDVQARTLTLNPTVVEVRFNYRPAFPVNYIQIGFSVDLNNGALNLSSSTNQVNTGA
jgi:hypothetical protein